MKRQVRKQSTSASALQAGCSVLGSVGVLMSRGHPYWMLITLRIATQYFRRH